MRDRRLGTTLHALLHMEERGGSMTSEELARCLDTHPVVVRRTLAGLRKAGLVASQKGRRGGWTLARELERISLRDVYEALGWPDPIGGGAAAAPTTCLVEQIVDARVEESLGVARAAFTARLAQITLAELAGELERRKRHHPPHRRRKT